MTAKKIMASVALLLAAPAMAQTDGMLGPSSSGTFAVNATYTAAPVDNVQVFGLDNINFNETFNLSDVRFPVDEVRFCMIRESNGGNIGVTVFGTVTPENVGLGFAVHNNDLGNPASVQLDMSLLPPGGTFTGLVQGEESLFVVPATCSEADPNQFSVLRVRAATYPEQAGAYSNTFTVLIAPK